MKFTPSQPALPSSRRRSSACSLGAAYAYNYGGTPATDDGHLESLAFAYGYICGLIQAVNELG